jgi:hypothetical protein
LHATCQTNINRSGGGAPATPVFDALIVVVNKHAVLGRFFPGVSF